MPQTIPTHTDPVQALDAIAHLLDGTTPTGGNLYLHGLPHGHIDNITAWALHKGISVTDRGRTRNHLGLARAEFMTGGVHVALWPALEETDLV